MFSTKMKKAIMSKPEALSDEWLHGTAALVGFLAFFISVLDRRGQVKKIVLHEVQLQMQMQVQVQVRVQVLPGVKGSAGVVAESSSCS